MLGVLGMGVKDPNECKRSEWVKKTRNGVKDPNGCKRLAVLSKKVLHGCERPAVLSEKFCMGVRDQQWKSKSSVA